MCRTRRRGQGVMSADKYPIPLSVSICRWTGLKLGRWKWKCGLVVIIIILRQDETWIIIIYIKRLSTSSNKLRLCPPFNSISRGWWPPALIIRTGFPIIAAAGEEVFLNDRRENWFSIFVETFLKPKLIYLLPCGNVIQIIKNHHDKINHLFWKKQNSKTISFVYNIFSIFIVIKNQQEWFWVWHIWYKGSGIG